MKILWILVGALLSTHLHAAEVVSMRSLQGSHTNVNSVKGIFSLNEGIALKAKEGTTSDGITKYEESYKGVPVYGHTVVVRVNKNTNSIDRLHGYAVRGINNDVPSVEAKIDFESAISKARIHHESVRGHKNQWAYSDLKGGLYIFVDSNQKAHLAYMVTFLADTVERGNPTRPTIFVDANTGAILRYTNQLTTDLFDANGPGGNKKTGQYHYSSILVDRVDDTCTMDTGEVMTVDLNGAGDVNDPEAPINDNTPYSFTCPSNSYKSINDAFSPLNDAHVNGVAVFKTYNDLFGISPLKIKLKLRVHFAKDFENAFWDGKSMTFGDGATNLYPTSTALDVTGHEVSHGFTEFNSGLEYRSEAGGINEAFSDIAGEAIEYHTRGKADWLIGGEIMRSGEALRYFADPTKDKMSIDNVTKFKWPAQCDALMNAGDIFSQLIYMFTCTDMHFSSGLYNKAYYLMATAQGSDPERAFAVFVRANQRYWTPTTTFVDGAKGVKDAAQDLGFDTQVVTDAFAAVGINI